LRSPTSISNFKRPEIWMLSSFWSSPRLYGSQN
jgi:hypothetical protein